MKDGSNAVFPGGPALDENAAAVGLITAHRKKAAGPSPPTAQRFLASPDFRLTAPTLTRANLHDPAEFGACLVSVFPPPKPWAVELVLRADDGPDAGRRWS